jgi:hypothetical protein
VQPGSPYLSSLSALLRHALPPLLSARTPPIRIAAPLQLAPLLAAEAVLEVCDGLAVGDCASHEIRSPVPLRKLLGEGAVEGVEFVRVGEGEGEAQEAFDPFAAFASVNKLG